MKYDVQKGLLVPRTKIIIGGTFTGVHLRDGKVIDEWEDHNLVVNQGLDHILATEFGGGTQITSWFMAPFGNNYNPVGTDTAASIVANAGEVTAYTASTRVPYVGVEGGQQVTNSASPANFTFTGAATIYGAMLISSSAQGSTAGVLFAAALFATSKVVANTDVLLITYAFGAVSA